MKLLTHKGVKIGAGATLATGIVALTIVAVPGMSFAATTCVEPWSSDTVYTGGTAASKNGVNYTANWWSRGDDPVTHAGPAGSGQPWTATASCTGGSVAPAPSESAVPAPAPAPTTPPAPAPAPTTPPAPAPNTDCATAWSKSVAYTGGQQVTSNGQLYRANWWTQGDEPSTHSGVAGSGQPWLAVGACSSGSITPNPTPTPTPAPAPGPADVPLDGGSASGVFFSAYKDATINMNWNTNTMRSAASGTMLPLVGSGSVAEKSGLRGVTLAFATGSCGTENWGGVPGASFASANIPALNSAGVDYVVSTGGAAGSFTCDTVDGMKSFIARYASPHLVGIDFDIEVGQTPAQLSSLIKAAAGAQKAYPKLRFSFTLATLAASDGSYGGLNAMGDNVVKSVIASEAGGLTNYTINLMTMDYGAANRVNCVVAGGVCDMGASAIQAAINLQHAYGVPAGRIELTPMIGVNDVSDEVFTLANVDTVVSYAKTNGLAGLHFWSLDRDTPCAAPQATASPICNSVTGSAPLGYTTRFIAALRA